MGIFNNSNDEQIEELIKQQKITNALLFLDSNLSNADSVLSVEQIKKYYKKLENEVFSDFNDSE